MKFLGYIMPFFFFGVLNSYSAGLSYYYLVINVLTIIQTYAIKAFLNEEKLKEKIHAVRATRTKKGVQPTGMAKWLSEQQKKQEATLRERRKSQGGSKK
jgi:YidC/Oxa1 family membrane protein insertase